MRRAGALEWLALVLVLAACPVAGPYAGREPVFRIIGQPHGFVVGIERHDRQNRPEVRDELRNI